MRNRNNRDARWPSRPLLDALGFQTKVRGRVEDYMEQRGIEALSLRELMDLFLPPPSEPLLDFTDLWRRIPLLDQPPCGPYLHDSALLTLAEADLGPALRAAWAVRLDRLKLYKLGERPAHKRRQRTESKRGSG